MQTPQEPKANNLNEIVQEMLPFLFYTIIPIGIIVIIAFIFGSTAQ